jgi:beta-lactamase regulating signal transducer with metallopeptidase domain
MDALLNWVWQGAALAGALFVMLLALERARANVRYIVCWAALAAIVTLPALPWIRLSGASIDALRGSQGDAMVSLPDTWWTSTVVLLGIWLLWITVHSARFVAAVAGIRHARAHSVPFPSHLRAQLPQWDRVSNTGRRATLVVCESVATAALLGCGAPMIAVAPALVETLDPDELDRILIHEWAHVQRRDDLVNIVQIVIRTVAGWHPALWWIDRRLQIEREIACDEITVAMTGSPKTYAECLVKLASLRPAARPLQGAPAVLTASSLRARIVKIVSVHRSIAPLWSASIAVAIVAVVSVLSIGLAGVKLVETTVLGLPLIAPPPINTTVRRVTPVTVPLPSPDTRTTGARPTLSRRAPRGHTQMQPASLPQPHVRSEEPVTFESAQALDSRAIPGSTNLPDSPPQRSEIAADKPPAPWTAAAGGGAAIGRKSKDAGIATAGFFSRFARRVAGSF